MAESDASVGDHNSESSVSESLGTETLQTRSMVPGSFHELFDGGHTGWKVTRAEGG
jgi:hypothetical protein